MVKFFSIIIIVLLTVHMAKAYETVPPSLEIHIDLTSHETSEASVSILFRPGSENPFSFRHVGIDEEFQIEDLVFYNEEKEKIDYEKHANKYYLKWLTYKELYIEYRVKPGGMGRHGRQGNISGTFASFDGRIFILPDTETIKTAAITFNIPSGWNVVTPFRKDGDTYSPDASWKISVSEALEKSFMAFGPFTGTKKTFGHTDVTVYAFSPWPEEHKKEITEKTFKLYEYFYKTFNFDPSYPYIVCWTPKSDDGKRVFTGLWSNGQCYEMPEDTVRNWEYFSHRLTHAMNRYEPTGMMLKSIKDEWVIEGWAVYMEEKATVATGTGEKGKKWKELYERYLKTMEAHSDWDHPLEREHEVKDNEAMEFFHYCKSPLVFKMLETEMKKKTGKTMEEFMCYVYNKYGNFKGSFPFKEELEYFTGISFEEFWNRFVREKGSISPVWQEEL